jgi:hypothetical protein
LDGRIKRTEDRGTGVSTPLPRRLARVRPLPAFIVALVLVLAGFLLPGIVGAAVLVALVGGLVYLSSLTWRVQPPSTRLLRVAVLAGLLAVAVGKVLA